MERTDLPKRGMYQPIRSISSADGSITLRSNPHMSQRVVLADILREVDIPELSMDTVPDLTTLAQIFMAFLRTLIAMGIIDEGLIDEDYQDPEEVEGALVSMGADEL